MISIEMSVREAIWLIGKCDSGDSLQERLIKAIELKCGDGDKVVTIRSLNFDNRIPAIKAIRAATGWGLREAKELTDDVMACNRQPGTGIARSISLSGDRAKMLFNDLKAINADVVISPTTQRT